ncbi:MAG: hypothetical protein HRU19_27720 [Pseudobacteriovorax sp.]|nr:hypothetical protein [Pseudobacteriovorax sp.]
MIKVLIILLIWFYVPDSLLGNISTIDVHRDDFHGRFLGLHTDWYQGSESITQVRDPAFEKRFRRGVTSVVSQGISKAEFWYRIQFSNSGNNQHKIYFQSLSNLGEYLEVYQDSEILRIFTSEDLPVNRIIPITIAPGDITTIYLKHRIVGGAHQALPLLF